MEEDKEATAKNLAQVLCVLVSRVADGVIKIRHIGWFVRVDMYVVERWMNYKVKDSFPLFRLFASNTKCVSLQKILFNKEDVRISDTALSELRQCDLNHEANFKMAEFSLTKLAASDFGCEVFNHPIQLAKRADSCDLQIVYDYEIPIILQVHAEMFTAGCGQYQIMVKKSTSREKFSFILTIICDENGLSIDTMDIKEGEAYPAENWLFVL